MQPHPTSQLIDRMGAGCTFSPSRSTLSSCCRRIAPAPCHTPGQPRGGCEGGSWIRVSRRVVTVQGAPTLLSSALFQVNLEECGGQEPAGSPGRLPAPREWLIFYPSLRQPATWWGGMFSDNNGTVSQISPLVLVIFTIQILQLSNRLLLFSEFPPIWAVKISWNWMEEFLMDHRWFTQKRTAPFLFCALMRLECSIFPVPMPHWELTSNILPALRAVSLTLSQASPSNTSHNGGITSLIW